MFTRHGRKNAPRSRAEALYTSARVSGCLSKSQTTLEIFSYESDIRAMRELAVSRCSLKPLRGEAH
jgi:hypothetical protein